MYKSLRETVFIFAIYLSGSAQATNYDEDFALNGSSIVSMLERKSKVDIVSFKPVGKHLALGLDFLLPFIEIPITREIDIYGNEPALININAGAVILTGILAASSAFASYFFRTYLMLEPSGKSEKNHRSDSYNYETELWSMLDNVKVIYKNSTGAKADTSLKGLLATIDETFALKGIDISSCLQKALCERLKQSHDELPDEASESTSTQAIDKIIDGLASLKWVRRNVLRYTSLNDVISENDEMMTTSNRHQNHLTCDTKYPRCKWPMSGDNISNLIGTHLKFT